MIEGISPVKDSSEIEFQQFEDVLDHITQLVQNKLNKDHFKFNETDFYIKRKSYLPFFKKGRPDLLLFNVHGSIDQGQVDKIKQTVQSAGLTPKLYSPNFTSVIGCQKRLSQKKVEPLSFPSWNYPLVDKINKFIVFWTPRVACTSLKTWFFKQIGLEKKVEAFSGTVHNFMKMVYEKKGKNERIDQKVLDNYLKVAVVRNPYKRALSSYMHQVDKPHFIKRYNSIMGTHLKNGKTVTFRQFAAYLHKIDTHHVHCHYLPQTLNNFWEGQKALDLVLRMENLSDDIHYLENLSQLPNISIPHLHDSKKAVYKPGENFADLDLFELQKKFTDAEGDFVIPHILNFYDDEIKKHVGSYYRRDLNVLGYDFEELKLS